MGNLPDSIISKNIDDNVLISQFGVWQVLTMKESLFDSRKQWNDIVSGASLFYQLGRDIYGLSPTMFILFMFSKVWRGVESALLIHLSSRLLRIIEVGLVRGEADPHAIYMAIIARLASVIFVAVLQWWSSSSIPSFRTRVTYHFETYLMRARLQADLASSQDPSFQNNVYSSDAWYAFEAVVGFIAGLLTSASQFALIIHTSRSSGGTPFALLCIAKPVMQALFSHNIWSKSCVVNATDPNYNRMQALQSLSGEKYRQDYISGNIGGHILKEYAKASQQLDGTCTDEAWEQVDRRSSPYYEIFSSILGDLPMVYCAINAIINPSKFSITSVAVFQQSSLTLRHSMQSNLYNTTSFRRHLSKIRNMYAASEIKIQLQDGDVSFPKEKKECIEGMELELRDITFAYPGSKKMTNAVSNVSLKIKAGQLVVIVGANGSGKSTIVKLLTRLYDPSSGTILIDGIPAQTYRAADLRRATATFTQDHNVFPLSLYENISLGHPESSSDSAMVEQAAKCGGASGFIEKLTDGFRTTLDPIINLYSFNVPCDPEHPLKKKIEEIQKKLDVSGGERQRLVASRTFMHLNSGKVKFVAVDEPSSALDPEGEFQLFDRLLSGRQGKTMVFVTHRFGHLTKYADVIVCMKDGVLAESGTHEQLLRLDGEYAKLYKIQADAFSSGGDSYLADHA